MFSLIYFMSKFAAQHRLEEWGSMVNECIVQWWFERFCKGDKSLEDEEHTAWSSKVDNDN